MAIHVVFYIIDKKKNSTRRPDENAPSQKIDCEILDSCSILTPKIRVLLENNSDTFIQFNYAYIEAFDSRYYYISNWTYTNRCWVADLKEDCLASWRNTIGNLEKFVLRASHSYNPKLTDNLYPTTCEIVHRKIAFENAWYRQSYENGCYILGIVSTIGGNADRGGVKYWGFSPEQFKNFTNFLIGDQSWWMDGDITENELTNGFAKLFFDPTKYIKSCKWYPIDIADITAKTAQTSINLGTWFLNVSCYTIENGIMLVGGFSYEQVPGHPQHNERGLFLNASPFSRYYLEYQPFGCFEIDGNLLQNNTSLICSVEADILTGVCSLSVNVGESYLPTIYSKCGVDIPIVQHGSDNISNIISGAGKFVGGLVSAFTGNIFGTVGGITGFTDLLNNSLSVSGNDGGSIICYPKKAILHCDFYKVASECLAENGKPLMETRILNTIPGYILCKDSFCNIPATDTELEEIGKFLTGGFYYE